MKMHNKDIIDRYECTECDYSTDFEFLAVKHATRHAVRDNNTQWVLKPGKLFAEPPEQA